MPSVLDPGTKGRFKTQSDCPHSERVPSRLEDLTSELLAPRKFFRKGRFFTACWPELPAHNAGGNDASFLKIIVIRGKAANDVCAISQPVMTRSSISTRSKVHWVSTYCSKKLEETYIKRSFDGISEIKPPNIVLTTGGRLEKELDSAFSSIKDRDPSPPGSPREFHSLVENSNHTEWFLRAKEALRGLAVHLALAISQWGIFRKWSFFPFEGLMSILLLASLPFTSASSNRELVIDLGVDIDVSFLNGTLILDIICLVVGLSLIGAFGWLVGFKNQMATTAALWLLAVISFTWYLSEGDNRWSLLFKLMYVKL